jgi:hypothetical protein
MHAHSAADTHAGMHSSLFCSGHSHSCLFPAFTHKIAYSHIHTNTHSLSSARMFTTTHKYVHAYMHACMNAMYLHASMHEQTHLEIHLSHPPNPLQAATTLICINRAALEFRHLRPRTFCFRSCRSLVLLDHVLMTSARMIPPLILRYLHESCKSVIKLKFCYN